MNWNKELWLIDHGASLYFHHGWTNWEKHANGTFPLIKDHVLLSRANDLDKAAELIREKVTDQVIEEIVATIPDDWLNDEGNNISLEEKRNVYFQFLKTKITNLDLLTKEAKDAK